MKYDVIIIGSGLGGLECANVLAREGRKVLVLERQMQAGGCMQSYRRHGLAFDTGMHYVGGLGEGGCLHAPFKYLGLMDLPWQRLDADGFDRVTIGERSFRFVEGYDAFKETLAQDFPHERAGLELYCHLLCEMHEHIFDAIRPDADETFSQKLFSTGAYNYLNETFSDPLLVNVLSGTALKLELCREKLPLYTFAQQNSGFIQSSWRLRGDGSLIVEKLVENLRNAGGEILCGMEVEELIEKDGQLVAARCKDGEMFEADIFISNVHPAVTCGLVQESTKMKRIYKSRMQHLENTFGMFTVSLALKPGALDYFNYNQYLYKEANVWDFYENHDQMGGVLISCPYADGGKAETLDILTPMTWALVERWADTTVGHRGAEYLDFKAKKAEECISLAERAIPGLSSIIEHIYTSTPLTYRDYNLSPEGSAYGIRKDFNNPLLTILSPKTPIPNLLLTGQNLALHGLCGVTMSALATLSAVLGKETVWRKVCQGEGRH